MDSTRASCPAGSGWRHGRSCSGLQMKISDTTAAPRHGELLICRKEEKTDEKTRSCQGECYVFFTFKCIVNFSCL